VEDSDASRLVKSLEASEDGVAKSLDRMVRHCANEFSSKVVLVTALDDNAQHFLARVGVDERGSPREVSFCHHALLEEGPLLIRDTLKDGRFRANPLVMYPPYVRSYLGIPIRAPEGRFLGTICLLDDKPEQFTAENVETLRRYASGVEDMLRLHELNIKSQQLSREIEKQNRLLEEKNRIFRQAEKAAHVGSWELDLETGKLSWTDGVYAIHGLDNTEEVSVEEAISFYDEEDQVRVKECIERAISHQDGYALDATLTARDGAVKRVHSKGEFLPRSEDFPARLVGVIKDVSDSYQAEIALRHAAEHDSLTELYNRYAFDRLLRTSLTRAKAQGQDICLLLIDLDGFKDVNDTLGHMVGDIVLEDTALRIAKAAPKGSIASRWGGDEFAVILPLGVDASEAQALGNLILQSICQRSEVSGHVIDVGATAGLVCGAAELNCKELIRRADTALFYGKKHEPGKVHVYSASVEQENLVRRKAIGEVKSAIREQRLYPGYQPIVELSSRQVVGYEALMRLNTREGKRLTATEVYPALLDCTMSREISNCMLDRVSSEATRLKQVSPNFGFVSINASEADLLSEGFADRLTDATSRAGLGLSDLILEVTETVLLVENSGPLSRVLWNLRERGVKIALDDFGTGYSSLSHLRDFPIDKVKIDGSFVRTLVDDHQSRAIVQALIGMATTMNIDVVAEGIETEAQRNLLGQMGCRFGQGYLFGAAQDIGRVELMSLENGHAGKEKPLQPNADGLRLAV